MRAILIGGTGLIGSLLLRKLLQDPVFTQVKSISRRSCGLQQPRLEEVLINFDDELQFRNAITPSDVLFCCIGTTQKKVAGDKTAYRKVDFDIAVNAARFCAAVHTGKYILVSSVGANAASSNFYLRLKGETEAAILRQAIPAVYIMRPSVLLGKREGVRWLESAAQGMMQALAVFLVGSFSKYKPISADAVAKAMLAAAKATVTGKFIYTYKEMVEGNL